MDFSNSAFSLDRKFVDFPFPNEKKNFVSKNFNWPLIKSVKEKKDGKKIDGTRSMTNLQVLSVKGVKFMTLI